MEYILIGTAVAGVSLFVVFFLRAVEEARQEDSLAARSGAGPEIEEGLGTTPELVSSIFSREDEEFIRSERDPLLAKLFRKERKRLALRWVERRKVDAAAIMRRHRQAARSAADLQPSAEVALMLRHAKLRLTCQLLSISVWMIGPQGLQGLTGRANAILQSVQNLNLRADRDGRKISA
jgi:hypothetical protein